MGMLLTWEHNPYDLRFARNMSFWLVVIGVAIQYNNYCIQYVLLGSTHIPWSDLNEMLGSWFRRNVMMVPKMPVSTLERQERKSKWAFANEAEKAEKPALGSANVILPTYSGYTALGFRVVKLTTSGTRRDLCLWEGGRMNFNEEILSFCVEERTFDR